jgi:hypothetical protein
MKIFKCQQCNQIIHFENWMCGSCTRRLGYLPELNVLSALEPEGQQWRALAVSEGLYRFCANAELSVCNWLVPVASPETFCVACRHNHTIPDLRLKENLAAWRKVESAKHRIFYSLKRLRLPLANRVDDPQKGLIFDFLAESTAAGVSNGAKVMTGHDDGLITINLKEADDAEREKVRVAMAETYRTLLGHFRHEIGHYFWDRLVLSDDRSSGDLETFRDVFGDERVDYDEALKKYYENGPPPDWQNNFISRYASTHPWEDFAETWSHYLHIVDTIEMGSSFGLHIHPDCDVEARLDAVLDFDPYEAGDINRMVQVWLPLAIAVNAINRCMGEPDLYPFVLTPPVIKKLGFIHQLIHSLGQSACALRV